jgi:MoxR-like ATPase
MARTATQTPEQAEAAIAAAGLSRPVTVSADNRSLFKKWLRAHGIPAAIVDGMSVAMLAKAYNDAPETIEQLRTLHTQLQQETNPTQTQQQEQESPEMPRPNFSSQPVARVNKWRGRCAYCGVNVDPGEGMAVHNPAAGKWQTYCHSHAPQNAAQPGEALILSTPTQEPAPMAYTPLLPGLASVHQPDPANQPAPTAAATPAPSGDAAAQITQAITAAIAGAMAGIQPAISEARIIELIRTHGAAPIINRVEITIPPAATKELPDEHRHAVFADVLRKVAAGVHVYLVGPAGSGKSTIAEQCARALDRTLYTANAVQSPYELTGFLDAQGRVVRKPFRDAYENGGVFLFDEIDASSADALVALNGALAQSFFAFPDGMVKRHPDFVCIAAANTFGKGADRQYVGRQQLDAASLDRYAFVTMDYDETFELAISGNRDWTHHVQAIRAAIAELKVRHVVSPRASISGAKLLAAGEAWPQVEDAVIWKGLDANTIAKVRTEAKRQFEARGAARKAASAATQRAAAE